MTAIFTYKNVRIFAFLLIAAVLAFMPLYGVRAEEYEPADTYPEFTYDRCVSFTIGWQFPTVIVNTAARAYLFHEASGELWQIDMPFWNYENYTALYREWIHPLVTLYPSGHYTLISAYVYRTDDTSVRWYVTNLGAEVNLPCSFVFIPQSYVEVWDG